MAHPTVTEEVDLLKEVNAKLDSAPAARLPSEASLVSELTRLRELMREGTKTEDQAALMEQWNRQSALLEQLRRADRSPEVDRGSPYFAHLRLREDGRDRDILLGKTTKLLSGVPIVDWRNAPISRVFYRYRQGDEYEEEIAGRTMSGEVVARRTLAIRDRRLQRVEAPEGIFSADPQALDGWRQESVPAPRLAGGEGAALRVHEPVSGELRRLGTDSHGVSRRADKHLPDIAGLIDPHQFELITRPSAGFVVIRGAAGSGKTTVALHRIAYLAYEDATVDSAHTLFVVFSPALRNYVSHVLPALRVENVQVRTFHDWAAEHFRRLFPKLPRQVREDTPAVVQRLKLHPALLRALERQIQRVPGKPTAGQVLDDWASVLSQPSLLEEVIAEVAPGAFRPEELQRACAWSRDRHEELLSWLQGDEQSQAELDAEDHALLLRAWQMRIGPLPARSQTPLRYRHIAVDEVQDFSPLEVKVLIGCLDQHQSITLAGDTQQHLMQDAGFTSWAEFFEQLGLAGTEVSTLQISYRCSSEIAEFAVSLLGDLREDPTPPVTVRSGPPVELFRFTDHGACVAFLADALNELPRRERLASVAVLTPSRELSNLYYRGLRNSEVPHLRQVEQHDFTFAPGVEVTEIEQVKGLEFDYVILVEVSTTNFSDTAAARRRLHVGATRAIHQLWLTSVATPSPLVRGRLPATSGRCS